MLDDRVEAIFRALKNDSEIGSLIIGKTPQGSWAHRTIIILWATRNSRPISCSICARIPTGRTIRKTYTDKIYGVIHRPSIYGNMPHSRKCRCERVDYANSMYVNIVPHLILSDGR
ncbi:hypothetical protein AB6813_09005 [bacterium RCC_150]